MSPDLERWLRDARRTLPDPDDGLTERVREKIVGSASKGARRARRWVAIVALTTVAAAAGFGFGQRSGPQEVQAAQPAGVLGAGFLPAEGWNTLQKGRRGSAVAFAANVPFRGDDVARSEATLPFATLARLPANGAVLVARLEPASGPSAAHALPLSLADAEPQLRRVAGRTLLLRRLRARVDASILDVTIFFGAERPSARIVGQAERQLQRLVVEAPKVSIRVELRQRAFTNWVQRWVDISGTIATSAAGELVEVHAKGCGPRGGSFYRVIGGTRSLAGGAWKLETTRDGMPRGGIPVNAYFRAEWDGTLSEPVLVRVPLWLKPSFNRRTRVARVFLDNRETGLNMRSRFIELQRKVPNTDQWVRVRRAKLIRARPPFPPQLVEASFKVRARRLTLRIFVPAETGDPCYSASVSDPFRS